MANLWTPPVSVERTNLSTVLASLSPPQSEDFMSTTSTSPYVVSNSLRSSHYRIRPARKLAAPYQHVPAPGHKLYLYCWALPDAHILEELAGVGVGCFPDTGRTIGLLFSDPISMVDPVCRLPLYLTRGMARAYVHLAVRPVLSNSQLQVVQTTHVILCHLLMELVKRELHSVTTEALVDCTQYMDQFAYNPRRAHVLGYLTIVQLCNGRFKGIDFQSSMNLMDWFTCRKSWYPDHVIAANQNNITPSGGVVSAYPCKLSEIHPSHWPGLIVRPSCLPPADVGLFVSSEAISPARSNADWQITCYRLSRHLHASRASAGFRPPNTTASKKSSSRFPSHLCSVHPLTAFLWFQLSIVPTVLYQLNRALLNAEFFTVLCELLSVRPSKDLASVLLPDRLDSQSAEGFSAIDRSAPMDRDSNRSIDHAWSKTRGIRNNLEPDHYVPSPSKILEATTFLGACAFVDLERLELLGDSVLQLISTLYVFSNSPDSSDEGYLTSKRSTIVSNRNLCQTALRRDWQEFCTSQPFDPPDHFSPPCFTVCHLHITENDPRLYVKLTHKSIANMMEALVGCFHQHVGLQAACRFLHTLDISLLDLTTDGSPWSTLFDDDSSLSHRLHHLSLDQYESRSNSQHPSTVLSRRPDGTYKGGVASKLLYQFRDDSLLLQALTHNSASSSNCYQRLEFLGDGVLHYIVTNFLFTRFPDYNPGQLTMHRQLLCKNTILAYALFVRELHPYIIHNLPNFQCLVSKMESVRDQDFRTLQLIDNSLELDTTGLPMKMFADVFEALIGAVFLDSHGDLPRTTQVVYVLLANLLYMKSTQS
ncbi:unnamed protein product [Dicrocoelium dendriticum]|nr:unnamed protein product [Dicrocoelium dendriticum]